MQPGDNNAATYLKTLFQIKNQMSNISYSDQDQVWIDNYQKYTKNGYNLKNLPHLLALIHPDFYVKINQSFEPNLSWKKKNDFTNGIRNTTNCQAIQLNNIDCIFNSMPQIRGKCEADHRWPNSLGGPSILDNRLILCRYHNGMKSNDVSSFNWGVIPGWLSDYLEQIYRLKI